MNPRHIVVMGVSGCGKSTVGAALAKELRWSFMEGDEHHPASNIAKMSGGTPLTDEDRWPWLEILRRRMSAAAARGESTVVACSALRQAYRDRLTEGSPDVRFVYLKGDREALLRNLTQRRGHFMKADLLDSQLHTLEEPADAWVYPCDGSVPAIVADVARRIRAHD